MSHKKNEAIDFRTLHAHTSVRNLAWFLGGFPHGEQEVIPTTNTYVFPNQQRRRRTPVSGLQVSFMDEAAVLEFSTPKIGVQHRFTAIPNGESSESGQPLFDATYHAEQPGLYRSKTSVLHLRGIREIASHPQAVESLNLVSPFVVAAAIAQWAAPIIDRVQF
jgi:hypothetical protein